MHNLFGYLIQMATYEGLRRKNPSLRPFVLARAFYMGSHRYGAVWTGDNEANWGHLSASLPMILSTSMGGLSFIGTDIGGFKGTPEEELLVRWYQFGAFNPFFRAHSDMMGSRREPWLFSAEGNRRIHNAILVRYKLLPYFYTLFREYSLHAVPVWRPMNFHYPNVPNECLDKQVMVGPDILLIPVLESTESIEGDLPLEELWYSYYDNGKVDGGHVKREVGMDRIGVFVRGGAVVTMFGRRRRSATIMKAKDPYSVVVYLDGKGNAEGHLYLDDGVSWGYMNDEYLEKRFVFSGKELLIINEYKGWECDNKIERIVIVGYENEVEEIALVNDNETISLRYKRDEGGVIEIQNPRLSIAGEYQIKISP